MLKLRVSLIGVPLLLIVSLSSYLATETSADRIGELSQSGLQHKLSDDVMIWILSLKSTKCLMQPWKMNFFLTMILILKVMNAMFNHMYRKDFYSGFFIKLKDEESTLKCIGQRLATAFLRFYHMSSQPRNFPSSNALGDEGNHCMLLYIDTRFQPSILSISKAKFLMLEKSVKCLV